MEDFCPINSEMHREVAVIPKVYRERKLELQPIPSASSPELSVVELAAAFFVSCYL